MLVSIDLYSGAAVGSASFSVVVIASSVDKLDSIVLIVLRGELYHIFIINASIIR
jgi:hypothetical protein